MDKIREARLEKMYNINGFEFTDEELDAAIESIRKDPNAFARQYGLTEDEADSALELVLLLEKADTHEERTQILQDWGEKAPKITEAVLEEVRDHKLNRENKNNYKVKNKNIINNTKRDTDRSSKQVVTKQGYSDDLMEELMDEEPSIKSYAENLDGNTIGRSGMEVATTSFNSATKGKLNNAQEPQRDRIINTNILTT